MGVSAAAAAFVVGAAIATQAGKSKGVQLPATPQAGKVPDANADLTKNAGVGQAGGSPGVAQTFLTGPGGVDPSLLNLGKSTLLGG
jgi:hypothetical protein